MAQFIQIWVRFIPLLLEFLLLMLTTYITDYHLMITSLLNMRQPCKPLSDHAGATYRYHNCNHHTSYSTCAGAVLFGNVVSVPYPLFPFHLRKSNIHPLSEFPILEISSAKQFGWFVYL